MVWKTITVRDTDSLGGTWFRTEQMWIQKDAPKKIYTKEETKGKRATNPPTEFSIRTYLEDSLGYYDDGYYPVVRRLLADGERCRTLHRTLIAVESLPW